MEGIAIKYIKNILLGTYHSQESIGGVGATFPLPAIFTCSQKFVDLFLVLHLRLLLSNFNRSACNHQLLTYLM